VSFSIDLHSKDAHLLHLIKLGFGVGSICVKNRDGAVCYSVNALKDMTNVIVPFFNTYPLTTKKRADFELLKLVVELMNKKEHLTMEGLTKIVSIKASMNRGLSAELQTAFPNIIPASRPILEEAPIKDPNWLTGFAEGESCFFVQLRESKAHRSGVQVLLHFRITQHLRDQVLINSLIDYFGCGSVVVYPKESSVVYLVNKISDILEKIIPFFAKYPLQGAKGQDFLDWCRVARIMETKGHLTQPGLEEIRLIKAGMNRGRSK
jgi:hypothetical protein